MWSRAPPKKAAPVVKSAPQQPQKAAPAVDAEAALKVNNEAESSDSESEEDAAPIQRTKAGRRAHVIDEEESPVKQPSSKRLRCGDAAQHTTAKQPAPVADASDDDSDWDLTRHRAAAAKGSSAAAALQPKTGDERPGDADADVAAEGAAEGTAEEAAAPAAKKKKGTRKGSAGQKRAAAPPAPGTVQVHDSGPGGPTRRKVQRTTYNDKGEEITEVVYEEEPAQLAQPNQEDQEEKKQGSAGAAQAEAPAAPPAKKAATRASSQSQDSGAAALAKTASAAAAAEAPKGGAKKAAAKGRAAAGQRGIMSFFAKKPS